MLRIRSSRGRWVLAVGLAAILTACTHDDDDDESNEGNRPGDGVESVYKSGTRYQDAWHARAQVESHRARVLLLAVPDEDPTPVDELTATKNPCPAWRSGVNPGPTEIAFEDSGGGGFTVAEGTWVESSCKIFAASGNASRTYSKIKVGGPVASRITTGGSHQDVAATGAIPKAFQGSAVTGASVLSTIDFLKTFNTCDDCDLTNVDLSGIAFNEGVSLVGADLSGAIIYNSQFPGADFTNTVIGVSESGETPILAYADFQKATVKGTVFEQPLMVEADFTASTFTCPRFVSTVLLQATMDSATWNAVGPGACKNPTFEDVVVGINAVSADQWGNLWFDNSRVQVELGSLCWLKGADLSGIEFVDSQFTGLPPDFATGENQETSGCPATGATSFEGSTLDGSSFFLSDLGGATFGADSNGNVVSAQSTDFQATTLDGASFLKAVLHGANFDFASAQDADFDNTQLGVGPDGTEAPAHFESADVRGATFRSAKGRRVDWSGAYLFQGTGDAAVTFKSATLDDSEFDGAMLGATSFIGASLTGASFRKAQCIACDFTNSGGESTKLEQANFDSAWIYGSQFTGAVLTNANLDNAECCSKGVWAFQAGEGAGAQPVNYLVTDLNSGEFDDVSTCPNGLAGQSGSGCTGRSTPTRPPTLPSCTAAGPFPCPFNIRTVAGTGTAGYSDGGLTGDALCAELNRPLGVAVDPAVNALLVADSLNSRVRAVTGVVGTSPTIAPFAGNGTSGSSGNNGPAVQAELENPHDVAVYTANAPEDDLVAISDSAGNTVRVVRTDGSIVAFAGTGTACDTPTGACGDGGLATSAQLSGPTGLWFDPLGDLFIADTGNNKIRKVDLASGLISTVAGTGVQGNSGNNGAATEAELDAPLDVVGDGFGNLYIADTGNGAVRRVDPAGMIYQSNDEKPVPLAAPSGLSINALDTLFVADTVLHQVATLSVWGVENRVAGDGTACADPVTTQCASPTPVCGDGGPALAAQLNGPVGIDAFSPGVIYLGDTQDQRVRILQAE